MRKTLFTKLMLLMAVVLMGAGTAWGDTVKDALTASDFAATSTTYTDFSNVSKTSDAVYAGQSAKDSSGNIQMRSKNSNSGIVSTTSGGKLKSVTITVATGSNTVDVYGSNTAYTAASDLYSSSTQGTKLGSVSATGTITVTGDYTYVGIRSNNGAIYLSKVEIEWETDGGSSTPTCATPTFSPKAGSYTEAQSVIISTETGGATIYYTTDGTAPTTESSKYTAAIPVSETMTIKAIAVADGYDNSAIATATYTIVSFEHAGTEADPYTVADARNAIDVNADITDVYATGIVSKIVTTYNSTYKNITFDISADGTEEAAQLRVYRCTGTDAADVQVGDVVVVKGDLTLYGSTYEFSQGCELVSLTHPVVPTLSVDPGTADPFTYEEGGDVADEQLFEVTGTNLTSDVITVSVTENFDLEGGSGFGNSTLTIASGDVFGVRPKDNLTEGNYEGTLTIASEGANAITIALSCTVTGYVAPSITAAETTVNVSAAESEGTINMTYTKINTDLVDVEFYESDGTTTTTYDWIDAEIDSEKNLYYTVGANTGEARTAYLKVYGVDNNGGDDYIYSELITITQAAYVAPVTYSLATSITSGKHYLITDGSAKAMGEQKSNNRAAVDVAIEKGTATVTSTDTGVYEFVIYGPDANGRYEIYDETSGKEGYLYAASGSANQLKTQATNNINGKWTITFGNEGVASIVADGSNRNVMQYNSGSSLFSCYSSASQSDVYLYEKDGEATPTETVTISGAKYATYYSENALDFTDTGVSAYVAKRTGNGSTVEFIEVKKVPALTGMLLKANAVGDFTVPSASTADKVNDNALIGVLKETTIAQSGIYVLMDGDKGVGFYKTSKTGFKLGAHTAYIGSSAIGARTFIALDEATAIDGIAAEKVGNGEIYNLQGQRVMKAQKGLYIVNGKKVVMK